MQRVNAKLKMSQLKPVPGTNRLACVCLAAVFLLSQFTPALALAPVTEPPVVPPPQLVAPQPKNGVKTGPRSVTQFIAKSVLSANPSDLEIATTRIFSEPLTPVGSELVSGENQAIASLVQSLKVKAAPEDVSALTNFISAFPTSRWTPSIESNLAELYSRTGYLTRAIAGWKAVWERTKTEKGTAQIAVANHAMANLLTTYARLGMKEELKSRFAEIEGRPFFGSDETKINGAHIGYLDMLGNEQHAFKCGPYAINTLFNLEKNTKTRHPIIEKAASTAKGTNLLQVKQWADQVGLKMQAVKRTAGGAIVVPSIMHWKLQHFAAIVAEKNGKYLLKDPTFDNDGSIWVSSAALDEESDGYFLIPTAKALPAGWQLVTDEEAKSVWGKGGSHEADHNEKGCNAPSSGAQSCEKPCGMAVASAYSMQATLTIADKPLFYQPPVGPAIDQVVTYDHLQTNQPSTFTFTNLGQNWNFNWLSYLTVDPITSVATLRKMGGGSEIYAPDIVTGLYSPSLMSQAKLVYISPGVYQRQMPDGSMQV